MVHILESQQFSGFPEKFLWDVFLTSKVPQLWVVYRVGRIEGNHCATLTFNFFQEFCATVNYLIRISANFCSIGWKRTVSGIYGNFFGKTSYQIRSRSSWIFVLEPWLTVSPPTNPDLTWLVVLMSVCRSPRELKISRCIASRFIFGSLFGEFWALNFYLCFLFTLLLSNWCRCTSHV